MSKSDCITPARSAEGLAPEARTKIQTAAMQQTELRRERPKINCTRLIKNATCIPEMATICVIPARPIAIYVP